MKKLLAVTLCFFFTLMAFTSCTEHPQFPEEETPNPISDFEYDEGEDGCLIIKRYIGTSDHVVIPAKIEDKPVTEINVVCFMASNIKYVSVPETIMIIDDMAFRECAFLETVVLHEGLVEIGSEAFIDCSALQNITLPKTLKKIGSNAFANCKALKHINIPASLTDCGSDIFHSAGLESVEIEEGLTQISTAMFFSCNLTEVNIPSSVTHIEPSAFCQNKELVKVTMHQGTELVDDYAFAYTALTDITIPSSVTRIYEDAFVGTLTLHTVRFEGDAPENFAEHSTEGHQFPHYTVYYHEGATGFTSPEWNGYTTKTW